MAGQAQKYQLIVIGGGAAGLAAAIVAARRDRRVVLLESNARVGKKLLQTGNGKCNLGSRPFDFGSYNDPIFVKRVLAKVTPEEVYSFLGSTGVYLREREGRLYPYSEQASTVLNALRTTAEQVGVVIHTGFDVVRITGKQGAFSVFSESGERINGEAVLLASGSPAGGGKDSCVLYAPYGHQAKPFRSALCPLITDAQPLKGWRGIRFRARVLLHTDGKFLGQTTDEVLVKDNGLSGSAIFTLSSLLARKRFQNFSLELDFIPELSEQELRTELDNMPLTAFLHKEIAEKFVKMSDPAFSMKHYKLQGKGLGNFDLAQVCAGGLNPNEFDENLQSKLQKGLYAAGEVLDIDGGCGGYNLTWAFATGLTVGGMI